MARVGTPEEWALRVVGAVARATDWSRVFVFRLADSELALLAAHGVTPEQQLDSRSMRLDGPSVSAQAVRRGEPVVAGRDEVDSDGVANLRRLGTPAYAAFPLVARGRVFGVLTLLDVHRRRVRDEEVGFLQAVANTLATGLESAELYGAVQAASRAKDDFLAVASHELRTPLTPLKGLSQSLLRLVERSAEAGEPLDVARITRACRTMDGQVDQLARLVNDLLDVSRMRAGRLELRPAETDLIALVATVIERFEVGGACAPRLVREVERLVGWWDAARLDQVVTNLVANAIKYGLHARPDSEVVVTVGPARGGDWARLSVRDSGIGIPTEQLDRLFEPFQRLPNALVPQFGGLGLGLYISRDIVERHGGLIWAESPGPGEGATFHVLLPRTDSET